MSLILACCVLLAICDNLSVGAGKIELYKKVLRYNKQFKKCCVRIKCLPPDVCKGNIKSPDFCTCNEFIIKH